MTPPELRPHPCPECGWSPVEVLKKLRRNHYLWCPKCRAIWIDVPEQGA